MARTRNLRRGAGDQHRPTARPEQSAQARPSDPPQSLDAPERPAKPRLAGPPQSPAAPAPAAPSQSHAQPAAPGQADVPAQARQPQPPKLPAPTRPDAIARRLAARQHGVVTRTQLLDAGVSRQMIERRLRSGAFRAVHRGVYLVDVVTSLRARLAAARLACGPTAVVSHRSAAIIRGMLPPGTGRRRPDITIRQGRCRPSGVQVHQLTTLRDDEIADLDGLRVTTPARTLLDLGAAKAVPTRVVERAYAEALASRIVREKDVEEMVARHRRHPGVRRLRKILAADRPALTRSEAEERLLALIRKAKAPPVQTNVRVGRYEVDFYWPKQRLVVEVDGYRYHSSRRAFEGDRRRSAELSARGLRVIPVTWREIERAPEALLFTLGRLFGSGA